MTNTTNKFLDFAEVELYLALSRIKKEFRLTDDEVLALMGRILIRYDWNDENESE